MWLLIIVPLGFATKFYRGPLQAWVNDSLGGLLYVVFWCLVVFLVFPRVRPLWIAAGVLLATCCLEFTQLLDWPLLITIRRSFLGRALIGTTFTWWDFPHCAGGAIAGRLLLGHLTRAVVRSPVGGRNHEV